MASPGFYNENAHRAFPFISGTAGQRNWSDCIEALPDQAIADAGFVMGLTSGFDPSRHSVQLASLARSGNTFTFAFVCDAPGLTGHPLTFTRQLTDPDYALEDAEALVEASDVSDSLYASDIAFTEEPLWSGYLVSGYMAALAAFLPSDGTITAITQDGGTIEPALLESMAGGYVSSVNAANGDRTRVTAPEGCAPVAWPFTLGRVFVAARGLQGAIRLAGGFNCEIIEDELGNGLTVSASAGAGAGAPCLEVPLFPGEAPPPGSDLLTGGPRCDQVLRTVNGAGGMSAFLNGGQGVQISVSPDTHTITVNVNMNQMSVCYSESLSLSESL